MNVKTSGHFSFGKARIPSSLLALRDHILLPEYLDHVLYEEEPKNGERNEQRATEDDERHAVHEDPRQQKTSAALKNYECMRSEE